MKYVYDVYGPRFIVKAPEGTKVTKGGIYMPTQEQDLIPVLCDVVSVGEGSPSIKNADKVLVNKHAINLPDRCINKDERLYIINEADVFALVREVPEDEAEDIVITEKK